MLSSVLVVVIVGAIIAVIAGATLSDGPKPATPTRDPKRTAPARPVERAERQAPAAPIAENVPVRTPALPTDALPVPEVRTPATDGDDAVRRTAGERLRAFVLLVVTVVTLGSVAAGLLGGIVLLGARALNRALG